MTRTLILNRCPATGKLMQQRRVHARLHASKVGLKSMPCSGEIDLAKTMTCFCCETSFDLKLMPCFGGIDSAKTSPCQTARLFCDTIFDLQSRPCYRGVDAAKTSPCQTACTRSGLGGLPPLERGQLPSGCAQVLFK